MYIFKSDLKADTEGKNEYINQLEAEFESFKDKPLKQLSHSAFLRYFTDGNRTEYESTYFERRKMLRDFALMTWLGNGAAKELLETALREICAESTWVLPAHTNGDIFDKTIDLFAAETAQTLSEIVSLLSDKLSDDIIRQCVREVMERVLEPFMNSKSYAWESVMKSNWCAVCGGCVGMAALYLIEDDCTLRQITDRLRGTFDRYYMSFADDGACMEGLYYWNYGMTYYISFLDLYRQRMGEEYPVNKEKLYKMADFARKACIRYGVTASFSDSSENDKIYQGLLSKLIEMFNIKGCDERYFAPFTGDECGRWCRAVRDIAWKKPAVSTGDYENTYLPSAQWAIIRTKNMSAAVKGGNNGEPHNHNDIGNIIIMKDSDVLLCDIGAGEYTADYFSDKRYTIPCNSSVGHSVPLIDGQEQSAGEDFCASDFCAKGNEVSLDIKGAYKTGKLKKCKRHIVCDESEVIITDEFLSDGEIQVTERFITYHKAEIHDNGIDFIIDGQKKGRLESMSECLVSMDSFIHKTHDGAAVRINAVEFSFTVKGKYTFLVKVT